jgi:hypothetical protein
MEAIYHQKNVTLACKTKSLEGPGQEAGHSRAREGEEEGEGLGEGRAEEEKRGSGVGRGRGRIEGLQNVAVVTG